MKTCFSVILHGLEIKKLFRSHFGVYVLAQKSRNKRSLVSKPIHVRLDFYRRDQPERFALGLFENRVNGIGLLRVKESRLFSLIQAAAAYNRIRIHGFPKN